MRLQRYLAMCGVAARRKCEEMIAAGRVSVNGQTVEEMGFRIDPSSDRVSIDGRDVSPTAAHTYILFNKPSGVICTAHDPQGRRTALSYFDSLGLRLFMVGRLDYDSEGLLLLTDDGDFANRMQHPRHQIEKEYWVRVRGDVTGEALERLRKGLLIEGDPRRTAPASVRALPGAPQGMTYLAVVLREGRNRQVRRMIEAIGFSVATLTRKRIGSLTDSDLPSGRWRYLDREEVEALTALSGDSQK